MLPVAMTLVVLSILPMPATGTDLQAKSEALTVITETAAKLCNNINLEGKRTDFRLTGQANAEIANLIKHLADLGIAGVAELNQEECTGLLQSDLVKLGWIVQMLLTNLTAARRFLTSCTRTLCTS